MSAIPPKHTPDMAPEKKPEEASGSLAMYQAAQSDATSFPVLQAFQQFIDQERAQARKKMFQLSLAFGILIVAVVSVFLIVGIAMMRNMSNMQTKLLDAALAKQQQPAPQPIAQPVVVQPAMPATVPPELSASLQQVAQAANALQNAVAKKDEAQKSPAQDEELKKMRAEMEKMRTEVAAAAAAAAKPRPPVANPGVSPAVAAALAAARETEAAKAAELAKAAKEAPKPPPLAAPDKTPGKPAAPAVAVKPPEKPATPPAVAEKAPEKPVTPVVAEALSTAKAAEKTKEAENAPAVDPRFPAATKDPPVCDANVKVPDAPAGMMSTAVPLKTKRSGTIPWHAIIPE